jgi:innexin
MVLELLQIIQKINSEKILNDDYSDRLNHKWTVLVLIIFSLLIGSNHFVGSSITCWCPAEFTNSMVLYANEICWIKFKYYVPKVEYLTSNSNIRKNKIYYYQWMPIILAVMAILFYVPFALWQCLTKKNSVESLTIIKVINLIDMTNEDSRIKTIKNAAMLINRAIIYDRSKLFSNKIKFNNCLKYMHLSFLIVGHHNILIYLFVKSLYLLNVFWQFLFLNFFMSNKFELYGFKIVSSFLNGDDSESEHFPRNVMCDFNIRTLGNNNHTYSVQCVLPVNIYNEKLFIFIWFWLLVIMIISFFSLIMWVFTLSRTARCSFIERFICIHSLTKCWNGKIDEKDLEKFVFSYLNQDYFFLLRIIYKNTNEMVTHELVSELWNLYISNESTIHIEE